MNSPIEDLDGEINGQRADGGDVLEKECTLRRMTRLGELKSPHEDVAGEDREVGAFNQEEKGWWMSMPQGRRG